MLGIRFTVGQKKKMVAEHAKYMLKLVKKRLARPANQILLDYFKTDNLIEQVLITKCERLLALDAKIWRVLRKVHADVTIREAMERTFSEKQFFSKKTPGYNAYDFCEGVGLHTCPYCNIMPIPTVVTENPRVLVSRPPLDHFFAKELYPLLAISFYNLVPGCDRCNNRKSNDPTHHSTHLNPHIGEFADGYVFRLTGFQKIDDVLAKGATGFGIEMENLTKDPRFDGNQALFHLDTLYSMHKEVAHACLVKSVKYSPAVISSISSAARSTNSNAYYLHFDAYFDLDQLHRHILSKLKRDIVIKFGSKDLKDKLKI